MPGDLTLSALDQARLTLAIELDNAGFPAAARFLRSRIAALRDLNWDEVPAATKTDPSKWADLFRLHRGSLPPIK